MAFLELRHVGRDYPSGEEAFAALKDVNLTIAAGEFVAIQGPSGSGKSTLMNLLGLLDRPTAGTYRVAGQDTASLDPDELAALRREHFGFIFQRYNLLPDLSALANVEVPAVYAGLSRQARHQRAVHLLSRLGLADRLHYRPAQLSGGQQQRVSVARALMNGGQVILADEPTGALDSHVGDEVLKILKELHAERHTIILVTHDLRVAEHAERVIKIQDGEIVTDHQNPYGTAIHSERKMAQVSAAEPAQAFGDRLLEALSMARLAMRAHRLRTFLTMLGIIIGIASVASVVALGLGGSEKVLESIRALGTNTLDVYPGKDFGDERADRIQTLIADDAAALASLPGIDSVTPSVSSQATLRAGDLSASGMVNGVGEDYFRVHDIEFAQGTPFRHADTARLAQVLVIDDSTAKRLFPNVVNPLGQVVFVGRTPFQVIGVTQAGSDAFRMVTQNLTVWAPYTAVLGRLTGRRSLTSITARVSDAAAIDLEANSVIHLLTARHRAKDFIIRNTDTIRKAIEASTATLTLLVASIALISLVVGGIGVMNIMLVSVTERTREIGIRTAVGARQRDILQQFLIEAVLVCLIGGLLGVLLALAIGFLDSYFSTSIPMIFSPLSIVAALTVSTLIGVTFGYLPARHAASLNPIDALARE